MLLYYTHTVVADPHGLGSGNTEQQLIDPAGSLTNKIFVFSQQFRAANAGTYNCLGC